MNLYSFPKLCILNKYDKIEDYKVEDFSISDYNFNKSIKMEMIT